MLISFVNSRIYDYAVYL